jgi:[ribosomal protein S5]-alanine N-acetyltransferase
MPMQQTDSLPQFWIDGRAGSRFLLTVAPPAAAARMVAYLRNDWDRFRPIMPSRPPDYFTEACWVRQLERAETAYRARLAVPFVLFEGDEDGEIAGDITYSNVVRGAFEACHLGYKLAKRYEGQGLMFAALRVANDFVFRELGLHRIMANHLPSNERSARLLARLGFEREGYARDYLCLDGAWRDQVLNSLVNDTPPRGA